MDKELLIEKIKKGRSLHFLSNCYSLDCLENAEMIWEMKDSFLFSYNDHGIKRLSFFVESYSVLDELLNQIYEGIYYFELMSKNPEEYNNPNVKTIAKMMRMSSADCSKVLEDETLLQYKDDLICVVADVKEAEEINDVLWDTFSTEVSHLLYLDELKREIKAGNVFIHKGEKIDAILQADIKPKKFYINQVVNKADKRIIHAIMIKQLERYVQGGGKYLYAWVDEKNIASVKFHSKYGLKHDGMWNIVYCIEK